MPEGTTAAIYGLAGTTLAPEERAFFAKAQPWGFILFRRNIAEPAQVAALVAALRAAVGWHAPVLIDQEGGRVARLRGPHWQDWRPVLTDLEATPESARTAMLRARYGAIGAELASLGIDVNCMPLLDLNEPGAHDIIGDRALGAEPETVAALGLAICEALLSEGVLPVVKHLPGHGRAGEDSHLALPRITAPLDQLRARDFAPFRALADQPLGMTAHIVYDALDAERCATLSPTAIRAIREEIGFTGCLMTDDISMGALSGPMGVRAEAALAAGCDLVLHCNGDGAEMEALAAAIPPLAGPARDRAAAALAMRGHTGTEARHAG